jgi:hypothetical protein
MNSFGCYVLVTGRGERTIVEKLSYILIISRGGRHVFINPALKSLFREEVE